MIELKSDQMTSGGFAVGHFPCSHKAEFVSRVRGCGFEFPGNWILLHLHQCGWIITQVQISNTSQCKPWWKVLFVKNVIEPKK